MHSDRLADTTITSITGILHTATVSVITSEADSSKANVQHAKHQARNIRFLPLQHAVS